MEKLFDTNQFGNYFVPINVIQFLITLANPLSEEKALDINLNPDVTLSILKEKTGLQPHYLKSNATVEDLTQKEQLYDVIVCGPTFGSTFRSPDGSSEQSEVFWLKWCIHHLSNKGRLAIIVPTGLLSNYSQQNTREFLIAQAGLQAIIELPVGWTKETASQASIMYITKAINSSTRIKMFRFTKNETIPWISLASRIFKNESKIEQDERGISFFINYSELNTRRLDVQYYDPTFSQIPFPNSSIFTEHQLADIATIRSGERLTKEDFRPNGIAFIQVRNVTVQGTIDLKNVQTFFPETATKSRGYCSPGDIIITTAGTLGKVALVDGAITSKGICIDTSLRRLQISDTDNLLPKYLAIYLRTPLAQQQIKSLASGSVISVLSSSSLSELKIFVPSIEKQQEIITIYDDPKLNDREKFQVSFYDKNQGPEPTKPIIITSPSATEPESQSFSLAEIVQYQLPFPIARSYTMFINSTHQSGTIRVKQLIDLSESIVYFLYNILISDQIRRLKIDDDDLKIKINSSFTSYSITRRLEVIFHIMKLARKNSSIDLFIPELLNLNLGVCSEIQNKVRNGSSHTSAFPENKCRQIIKEYLPKMEKLLDSLRPLKSYILTQVIHITVRNGLLEHHIISMTGNNALFQPQVIELERESILLSDSLHVILLAQARGYEFLDLHPFYLIHAWENTGEYDHLCFFKQVVGNPPERLKVESTQGVNDTTTETDMEFNNIVAQYV